MSAQPVPPGNPSPTSQLKSVPNLTLASSRGGGSGSPFLKGMIAALIVVLAIGAYVYFNEKPPVAAGEILHVNTFPIHRDSKGSLFAAKSIGQVDNSFDQVIVIADVRVHNQSDGPLFLSDMSALLSLPSEEQHSIAANMTNFNRVFAAYPELASMKGEPLLRDTTIPAGATVEGQIIFNYPLTKEQWDQRKSMDVTLSFLHQKDLVLSAPE